METKLHPEVVKFITFLKTVGVESIDNLAAAYRSNIDLGLTSEPKPIIQWTEESADRNLSDDRLERLASQGWRTSDVKTTARLLHAKTVSHLDALKVLKRAADQFDEAVGIDFNVLGSHLDFLVEACEVTLLDHDLEETYQPSENDDDWFFSGLKLPE